MRRIITWLNDHMPPWLRPLWRILEVLDTVWGFYDKVPDPARRVMWLVLSIGGLSGVGSLIKLAGLIQLNYVTTLNIAFVTSILVWALAVAWNPRVLVGRSEADTLAARAAAVARSELAVVVSDGIRWVTGGGRYRGNNTLIVRPECPTHHVLLYCEHPDSKSLDSCRDNEYISARADFSKLFCSASGGHRLVFDSGNIVRYENAEQHAQALLEAELTKLSQGN